VRAAVVLQVGYVVGAVLLLLFGGISAPPRRLDAPLSGGAGLAVALGLYAILAHGADAPDRRLLLPALVAGVTEEVVWRWGALAGTAPLVGWAGSFALSTLGFASRHTRSDGFGAYLLLGASFGGIFLATGKLVAAIAAHAGYNTLVLLRDRR
jgi:membrane protease YdiL (CAAX protease family)